MHNPRAAKNLHIERQHWLGTLARGCRRELEAAWCALTPTPRYALLRQPETGLVLVRGRVGGTGVPFNMGEMTMTRCAVRLLQEAKTIGLSFIVGRDQRHAELAAVFDALLQDPEHRNAITAAVIAPIESRLTTERGAKAAEIAATRVDFFTLAREQA
jgi:alpha-D-ribose 1-methylphosphonate 5-triphosphate synthase subunit PhnG